MRIPLQPPPFAELFSRLNVHDKAAALLSVDALPDGDYHHWDKLRHRTPPAGLTHEEWWAGIKLARGHLLKPVPLRDKRGNAFRYCMPDPVLRLLHEIDQRASGRIQLAEEVTNPATRDRYIVSSLIEESITSSQLEGASTTTEVARNLIRTGRRPRDRSEQMILNNYRAMRFVQENANAALTPALFFELHRIAVEDSLDEPARAGAFRTDADNIAVHDETGRVLHLPPRASELPERLATMCDFTNERRDETFVHPVVRAIVLHFWVGYDHPFVDGNGRTARALFYWSMLSQKYWMAEFISISKILKNAPGRYGRSFLYTETDENDLTYFLLYQLRVIHRAIEELEAFLERKMREVREVESLLRRSASLNHRQLALIGHALKHPGMQYTIESHRKSHNVVYQTARTDLLGLAGKHLLVQRKRGKGYVFGAPADLAERLARVEGSATAG